MPNWVGISWSERGAVKCLATNLPVSDRNLLCPLIGAQPASFLMAMRLAAKKVCLAESGRWPAAAQWHKAQAGFCALLGGELLQVERSDAVQAGRQAARHGLNGGKHFGFRELERRKVVLVSENRLQVFRGVLFENFNCLCVRLGGDGGRL